MTTSVKYIFVFIGLIFCSFPATTAAETGSLNGVVLDSTTQTPLPGANIQVQGTVLGTSADENGEFYLNNLPSGKQTISVNMIGYKERRFSIEIQNHRTLFITILLQPTSLKTPQLVVTGAKRSIQIKKSPVSIGTISSENIRMRLPTTVEEVLPYQSGVQVVGGQVNIRGSSGYARGVGSRVLLLVDGLPVLASDNGGIYWDAVPSNNIQRVEILKGPGSALYGSNALGGVINIITSPIKAKNKTSVLAQGGYYTPPSHQTWQWRQEPLFTGKWVLENERRSGNWGLQAAAGQESSPGYFQNGWYRRWFLRGKMEYKHSSAVQWNSRLFMMNDIHGSFTQWRSAKEPFNSPIEAVGDYLTNDKLQWALSYSNIVSASLSHRWQISLFRTAFRNHFHDNKTYSTSYSVTTEWQTDYQWGNHLSTGGFEVSGTQVNADIWSTHSGYDLAAYLQDEWHLTLRWRLTAGIRADFSSIDQSQNYAQINPKIGTNYALSDQLSLRASLGRAFRTPSIAEQFTETQQSYFEIKPNPNLSPETSLSGEIGMHYESGNILADIAGFLTQYQDLIEPQSDPSDGKIYFQNITNAKISGVEFSADWKIPYIPVKQSLSYTYLNPRDVSADTVLAYRHQHVFVFSNEIPLSRKVYFGIDYQYRSKFRRVQLFPYNPATGADKLVPIHLWSFTAYYQPGNHLTLRLSLENAFQYYYVMIERNMGAPRQIKLGVEYVF